AEPITASETTTVFSRFLCKLSEGLKKLSKSFWAFALKQKQTKNTKRKMFLIFKIIFSFLERSSIQNIFLHLLDVLHKLLQKHDSQIFLHLHKNKYNCAFQHLKPHQWHQHLA